MKIFIEASTITAEKMSGVGHATLGIIYALDRLADKTDISLTIIIPSRKKKAVPRFTFKHVKVKTLWLHRYINFVLTRISIPIPVDLILGRGVYVFPNYSNWYVPFSKSITFIDDISFLLYPDTVNYKNRRFLVRNVKRWIKRTNQVVTISRSSSSELSKYYRNFLKSDPKVIYLGVNNQTYSKQAEEQVSKVSTKYGLGRMYLLYVGNIEPRKNITRLIDAYRILPRHVRNAHPLVLIGSDGWNNDSIKAAIHSAQEEGFKIVWPQQYVPDEDMPAVYSGAVLLVHPSLYEGFGMTMLEAMSIGTPVVANRTSSIPEILGDAGEYVDSQDVRQLSAKICSLLKSREKRKLMASAGITRAHKFSWDSSAAQLLSCLRGLES